MAFLSNNPTTSKLNTTSLHPPKQSPTLSHLASSASASPSPTSSTSSYLSYFDNNNRYSGSSFGERRESTCSYTSWGSMGETPSSKPPDDSDITMEEENDPIDKNRRSQPNTSRLLSTTSIESSSSSSSSSSSDPKLATPEFPSNLDTFPTTSIPNHDQRLVSSPSSSTTSTAPSKGECTPRAELPAPIWPHASASASSPARNSGFFNESFSMSRSDNQLEEPKPSTVRKPSLRRGGSWRRKHASLDTPPTAPHLDPDFPGFTALKHTPPLGPDISQPSSNGFFNQPAATLAPPQPNNGNDSPDVRRLSGESFRSTGSGNSIIAQSPTTGCEISAPKAPPVGYPLPSLRNAQRRFSGPEQYNSPSSSDASTFTSSSSSSSNKSRLTTPPPPHPPRWACPPAKTNAVSGRALSFGSSQDKPDVSFDDFDPELFEGSENEWIEIIKGAEGRIAIKSTPQIYDIMVWLPGFSLDDILIATRGTRTVHIVADQWDEGDHAQWDIKLGEDANLKSVKAQFTGKELRITVAREQRFPHNRFMRMVGNRPALNSTFSSPSITATSAHNPLERTTVAT
ncbi:uncharacterized protein L201_003550 [Kwoniella dendrophila CBS 6074]|uniref:SHSP domain-containing protein n=1 Tax=Kwoniella dendrophila CBS 6074 TaxID=1295534 RepID=A0AAX4JTD8_9TREE